MQLLKSQYKIKKHCKNIFVIYLAFVTGCTNIEQKTQTPNVINSKNNSQIIENSTIKNELNLPTLDLEPIKKETNKKNEFDKFIDGQNTDTTSSIQEPKHIKTQDSTDLQSMAIGSLSSETSEAVKDWFSIKHATAQLNIGASKDGVKTGSFDILVPLFDTKTDIIFTQLGFRRSNRFTEDYRNTINMGLGYRHNIDDWMLGVNSFYDRDITGKNDRVGLGVEAWTNFLKLSANSYTRLSNWKQSPDLEYYQERPANGWDVRAEAYLPEYPQLGCKLMYEQYYGNDVGLFGSSSRQKDPSATTAGLSYTPIPLVSLATDYRKGQNGLSETSIKLGLNIQLGVSLKKQLSSDEVRSSRLISNARYNLVNRNNEIVMDYKQDALGTIQLPATLKGNSDAIVNFPINLTGNISNITWSGTASSYATTYGGGSTASIKIPTYIANSTNTYSLKAIGTDRSGRVVESNIMQINVDSVKIVVESSSLTTAADGTDAATFTATLTKDNGEAIPNTDVTWKINGTANIVSQDNQTNSIGKAHIKITSRFARQVMVSVSEPSGETAEAQTTFVADPTLAKVVSVTPSITTLVANGITTSTLTALVQDTYGNPVGANITVNWNSTLGHLSSATSLTDINGKATITLSSNSIGEAIVTASSPKGNANSTINFIADNSTYKTNTLISQYPSIVADNITTDNLTVLVKDANGNLAPAGVTVNWSTSLGTLGSASSLTDANGRAINTIKSSIVGSANISSSAANGISTTVSITFTQAITTQIVTNLTASTSTLIADNTTKSTLTAIVQDGNGHPVGANVSVSWSVNNPIGTLGSSTSLTDVNGQATNTLVSSSNTAGSVIVTATSKDGSFNTTISITRVFVATVVSVIPSSNTVSANGTLITLTALVQDSNGQNAPANTVVNWNTTFGTLSANSSIIDSNGNATVSISSMTAGTGTVTATSGNSSKTSDTLTFTEGPYTVVRPMNTSKNYIKADGIDVVTFSVSVLDVNGHSVGAGLTIDWVVYDDVEGYRHIYEVTDGNGHSSVDVTTQSINGVDVAATIENNLDYSEISILAYQ